MRRALAVLLVLAASGCVTAMPTELPVSRETPAECTSHCEELGMRLSAVVIIMNAAGCVCEPKLEPKQAPGAPPSAGAAAAAGGALLASRQRQQLFSPSQPPHVPPPGLPWTPYGPRH